MKILNQKGQILTEYLILMILVSLSAIGVVTSLGKQIRVKVRHAKERIAKKMVFDDNDKDDSSIFNFGGLGGN